MRAHAELQITFVITKHDKKLQSRAVPKEQEAHRATNKSKNKDLFKKQTKNGAKKG